MGGKKLTVDELAARTEAKTIIGANTRRRTSFVTTIDTWTRL
jgi:hypothetical protein